MNNLLFSGGVLFAIILEACPVADNKKEGMNGGKATIKSGTVLQELAQISGIKRNLPLATDASEYKKCTAQGAMHLQTDGFINDFEKNITTKYHELHQRTVRFIDECFFDCNEEHEATAERIFYALDLSKNIPDNASFFYIDKNYTKKELLSLKEIDLAALILSVWFYCIKNIRDNKKGSDLFKQLFANAGTGNIYHFNETVDNKYKHTLKVNSGNPNIHIQHELPPLEDIVDEEDEETEAGTGSVSTEERSKSGDITRITNPSSQAQNITFNFTVNGDNANVRNIVNNGTYIEGGEDEDE